jgi:hypothetical protein
MNCQGDKAKRKWSVKCCQEQISAEHSTPQNNIIFLQKNRKIILTNQNNSLSKEIWGFAACRPVNKPLAYDNLLNPIDIIGYQKTGKVTKTLVFRRIRVPVAGVIHKVINRFCG